MVISTCRLNILIKISWNYRINCRFKINILTIKKGIIAITRNTLTYIKWSNIKESIRIFN